MLLTEQQVDEIKKIITKHFNAFLLSTIGAEALSSEDLLNLQRVGLLNYMITNNLFKDAFKLGKDRKGPKSNLDKLDYKDWRLSNFQEYISALDRRALNQIEESTEHYTKKLKDGITNKLLSTILEKNRESVRSRIGSPIAADPFQEITQAVDVKKLAKELEQITKDSFRDWERVVTTELNSAYSQGAIHSILEDNLDKDPEEIMVYMEGPLDEGTCKWCRKFYHQGNSFKVYKLTELLANGTNVGRKPADWLPVIPPMHPRCRHRVVELPKGFSLDENGKIFFVDSNHHELNNPIIRKSLKGKVPTFTGWKLQDKYRFQGMNISIERKAGSYRSWKNRSGKAGKTLMHNDYGYIRNTLGPDGDHVDCYIGPNKDAIYAYVINQHVPPDWKFDEHKVMLGFDSLEEAKKAYLKHYDNDKFFGGAQTLHIEDFKRKVLGKETTFIKSRSHKYIKRTGSPGNYRYWYKLPNGKITSSDMPTHDSVANVDSAENSHFKDVKDVVVNGKATGNKYYESHSGEKIFVDQSNNEYVIDHSSGEKVDLGKHEPSKAKKVVVKQKEALVQQEEPKEFQPIKPDKMKLENSRKESFKNLSQEARNAFAIWTSGEGGKDKNDIYYDEEKAHLPNHYVIRDIQRGKKGDHNLLAIEAGKMILKQMDAEFHKLPVYEGTIYRGIDTLQIPPAAKKKFLESLQEGKEYTLDAYSSFTYDKHVADMFGDVQLIIPNNKAARDVSFIGEYSHENEVLAPKGTKYTISKVERDEKGKPKRVFLEETNERRTK